MSAGFSYRSFMQYNDIVGIFYSTEAMRYYHHRFIFKKLLQITQYFFFIICIQRVGSFIEEYIMRIFIHRPGNKQPLLLPGADAISFGANSCIKAQWQAFDIVSKKKLKKIIGILKLSSISALRLALYPCSPECSSGIASTTRPVQILKNSSLERWVILLL